MKLTPWYPENIKPVRVGVYEAQVPYNDYEPEETGWSFWNGKEWGWLYGSWEAANLHRKDKGGIQEKSWRGLAKKP